MTHPDAARRVRERMDGDYEVPVLAEPDGGPVPRWRPAPDGKPPDDIPSPGGPAKI